MSSPPPTLPTEELKRLLEEHKREILSALQKSDPRSWKLVSLVLPVFLTGAFSMFMVKMQADTADKVERESKAMQARLSLTQDYYRERLRIYQSIHQSVIGVKDRAQVSSSGDGLDTSVGELYHSYANNSIFLTRELESGLHDLWRDCMSALRTDKLSKAEVDKITDGIDKVELQMRRDLLIDELTIQQRLIEPAETPAVPAASGTKTP